MSAGKRRRAAEVGPPFAKPAIAVTSAEAARGSIETVADLNSLLCTFTRRYRSSFVVTTEEMADAVEKNLSEASRCRNHCR